MTRNHFAPFALLCGVAAAGMLGACGNAEPDTAPPLVRDSAGIRIVENSSPAWGTRGGWRIAAEPAFEIGHVEGPEAEQLHRVVGAVRLADGTVVVADAGSGELRWFGTDGAHRATAGGLGDGPGEFSRLSSIGRMAGDSVLAWDRQQRRASVFVDGRLARDARPDLPEERALPVMAGVLDDGGVVAVPGPVYIPEQRTGVQRPEMPVWLLGPGGERVRTLHGFAGPAVDLRPAATPNAWLRTAVPFGPETLVAAAGRTIAVGDNATYELHLFDGDGELRRVVRAEAPPRPVREQDLEAELERRLAGAPPVEEIREPIRRAFRETPAPERMPAYRSLRVDADGNVWVRRDAPPTSDAPVWEVFDAAGRWLGAVPLPARLEITDIGRNYVLGRWEDEMGVEYVRLYDLVRP